MLRKGHVWKGIESFTAHDEKPGDAADIASSLPKKDSRRQGGNRCRGDSPDSVKVLPGFARASRDEAK
jgi:hypothetical protein